MSEITRTATTKSGERDSIDREAAVNQTMKDLLGRHAEELIDPENRLRFIESLSSEDVMHFAGYANAKLRGEQYHQLRQAEDEKGGFLPMLHTPSRDDKPAAFRHGYDAITEYLADSDEGTQDKLNKVATAIESLVIWVHPFNDGNGRTSRFLGKFIEEGGIDRGALGAETFAGRYRQSYADGKFATKESLLAVAKNDDIILDDDERQEIIERAATSPSDIEGMYLSIKNLLTGDGLNPKREMYRERGRAMLAEDPDVTTRFSRAA